MGAALLPSPWLSAGPLLLRLFAIVLILSASATAVKLKMQKSECIAETIKKPGSLVTVAIVASEYRGQESYFDIVVSDPEGSEIYSRQEIDTAEISFTNRIEGPHRFCFTVNAKHASLGSGIASPRVGKKLREVSVDIIVGEVWTHERVLTEHLDTLMESISDLKIRMQKLKSEVRYLKFREIRHRKTVKSTAKRVTRYALGKMVVIIIIALAQPIIIAVFFQRQFKY
eukprot:jgi/Ulvmu1/3497/UM162_0004.1